MEAIVSVSGHQYQVKKGQKLSVNLLDAEPEKTIELDVLATLDGDKLNAGQPLVEGSKVVAKVLGHKKGDKVVAQTYKRRKGVHKKKGFRADLTEIEIQEIKG